MQMASELVPKDEREISLSVEVGTGAFLPGGKFAVAFKRVWQRRAKSYLDSIAAAADVSEQIVIETIAGNDIFADVFASGLQTTTSQNDEAYRSTFTHFVARALNDPAKVDVIAFLLEKFGRLRPPHIRVFWTLCLHAVEELARAEVEARLEAKRLAERDARLEAERRKNPDLQIMFTTDDLRRAEQNHVQIEAVHEVDLITDSSGVRYSACPWSTFPIQTALLATRVDIVEGILLSLMRDLYNEGILGEAPPHKVTVTELGKLAYDTVGEAAAIQIASMHDKHERS
jgi:hypothetical protein